MEKTSLLEPSSKTITALVVDDEDCTRMVHRMLLFRQGIEAVLAENGKEAVDLIRSGQNFDLILMDRDLPVMNGIEVCMHACSLLIYINANDSAYLLILINDRQRKSFAIWEFVVSFVVYREAHQGKVNKT